ncbi:flagellar hook-associated protein FlgK [Puniceibacterium sp. IMCC21224]|uniref:flagellar hook-associated protein FlgK n=1 Tax=Puniceibacterium sp. IMCC21224 TaxID=1618204 RepID=UPI00064D8CE8|nr:flagellar hook-associated protein FlgK [Puniceibacterium sp. IMCC21224]KMK65390.1 flagellar hook-associated protein FlgK [Puniceibacterium sp. IMCC21224]
MSLSGALSNALSGLRANTRSAGIVSSNISNALTDGYGRRELALSSSTLGGSGGVRVDGVIRHGDPVLLSDRRISDALSGNAETLQGFATKAEFLLGDPSDTGSLAGRLGAFENAFITAASNPSATQRLETVAQAAKDVASTLNTISKGVQTSRETADSAIARQVEDINSTLQRVEALNTQIAKATRLGQDPSALIDERQINIDAIAKAVPLRSVPRDDGMVAIYSIKGATLLDGSAATLEFTQTQVIQPQMTQGNGLLGGLTINGRAINTSQDGPLAGGTLAANFQIRDLDAVGIQAQLDGVARDLVERLGPGGADTTLAAGDPGFFTDAGALFISTDETGLAGRIAVNTLVAPGSSEIWRIRDGLGAVSPGEVGDASLLQAIQSALTETRPSASVALGTVERSMSGFATELTSSVAAYRVNNDAQVSYARAQNIALRELEAADGVSTDAELQVLMQIEQNYAANARVMNVVGDLMQVILSI